MAGVLGVALGVFLNMLIGAIYYSRTIMGTTFLRLSFPPDYKPTPPTLGFLASAVGALVALPVFNFFLTIVGADTWAKGAAWGCTFALFDTGINMPHSFFEERPFGLYWVHRLYHWVTLVAIGAFFATVKF